MNAKEILHKIDPFIKTIVIIGIIVYLIELSTGSIDSYHSHKFFLWFERIIATIFTLEYALRWISDKQDEYRWHYPHSLMGIIDLISIIPFWLGFFVPIEYLHTIRTFRIFRLLKFFRYSRSLQIVALGFYRAVPTLKPLFFSHVIIALFCTVSIYEFESVAQPDKFPTLFEAFYFTMTTIATVGYGDLTPITTMGRIVVIITYFTALAVFAGILGVLAASFFKVTEQELDPNIDIIEEYKKERAKQLLTYKRIL